MDTRKRIALVAHDKKKQDLLDWVLFNREKLRRHTFWSSGSTGKLIQESCPDLEITPSPGPVPCCRTDPSTQERSHAC